MAKWKEEIRQRLASLNLAPTREAEIVEELAQHIEDRYEELLAGGASEEEASRMALAELSESDLLARELRRVERSVKLEPEVLGVIAQKFELMIGKQSPVRGLLPSVYAMPIGVREKDELLRVLYRKRAKHHCTDDAKDGRIRPYAECQSQHCYGSEAWILAQHSHRVAQV